MQGREVRLHTSWWQKLLKEAASSRAAGRKRGLSEGQLLEQARMAGEPLCNYAPGNVKAGT
jgi:hypothetical protein